MKEVIKPARDWLLLDMKKYEYKGTIIIPDSAKDAPVIGEVVAVGPGESMTDRWIEEGLYIIPLVTKVGDRVLFAKYAGAEIEWDGMKLLLVRESEIVAYIVEDLSFEKPDGMSLPKVSSDGNNSP